MNIKNKIKTILTFALVAMTIFGMATSANAANLPTELGILDVTANSGINPATGVAWALGDTYRLVFVTSGTRDTTLTDIADYNAFVQGVADASSLGLGGGTWKVIGSTETVDARDNTSTNTAVNGTGEAIFLVDGSTIVVNDYADLWDGGLDNGINLDENGISRDMVTVFAGTMPDGTQVDRRYLGTTIPSKSGDTVVVVEHGRSGETSGYWIRVYNAGPASSQSFYALSDPLTVGNADPNAPTVDAGVDMITWSGQGVLLAPTVDNNNKDEPQAALTYLWSADPDTDVVFSATDVEAPTVTITKATDNPSAVTLTLAVNNVGRLEPPVEETMTIDLYDDSCLAAKGVGPVAFDPGDVDEDCITNLEDFAVLAAAWLDDYTITAPVAKP